MPRQNLYIVLGIPPSASADKIRSAYRALAKTYHPDRIGPSGAPRFREISEAYQVLSDPALRDAHNAALREDLAPSEPIWGAADADIPRSEPLRAESLRAEPIGLRRNLHRSHPSVEDDFVDWTMRNSIDRGVPKSGYRREANIEVILAPAEALLGGILPIEVPSFAICAACAGSGHDWYSFCLACSGTGIVEGRRTMRLQIPALVRDGTVWEIPVLEGGLLLRVMIRIDPYGR